MTGSATAFAGSGDERATDILYESATTRVYRRAHGGATVVCKEPVGADAQQRLHHEHRILAQLAGVEGVAHLAAGAHAAGILALHDCAGVPLAELLRSGPFEIAALLPLAQQLAQSVAALHRAGVIHRDINPSNILLAGTGALVLIDFDLALPADQHAVASQPGRIVGTLGYLAPEQTGRTGRGVDQRADLYAVGATLYEMATGRPPFEGSDTLQLVHDHLVREPVAPAQAEAHVPRGLSDIIMRLLAKAPEQRYQSAEGLLHDLARLRGEYEAGQSSTFMLGERDFAARLDAPTRLVGRSAESAKVHAAWSDALHSPSRTVLIEGAAGVGKSALINELRPVVAAAGGWFVHGKVDQYQRDAATAGAMTQALRALGRLLLAQPREEVAAQRRRILDALGRNAGLMTRLLPEFALLLGVQANTPEVDPQQAELLLHQATVELLGVIASPERPLVIVLDDLQWAPANLLRGFEGLMSEPGLRGLLLVGAYRGEEVASGHALANMLAQWRRHPQAPRHIALANLDHDGMGELTAQMLRLDRVPARALARAVAALTGGNPFDTVEMINALRREGVLSLRAQGWQWEEAAIRHFVGRGNVVDLLAARIARLPAASRELLEFMSCLGNSVDRRLLRAATGLREDELGERLRAALDDGLLVLDPSNGQDDVQFRHDRVQQAVLGAMDDAHRGDQQLAMARRLAIEPAFQADAAQQYLACVDRLDERDEQRSAARMFRNLADKLAGNATYLLAERYLAAAGAILAAIDDPADASVRAAIDAGRHAALYSLGRLDEADACYLALQARMADVLDQVEPACLQMRSLDMRGHMDDAIRLGLGMLARLGLEVPPDYAAPDTEQRLDALNEWIVHDSQFDHANRPQISDPRLLALAKLLGRTVRSALVRFDTKAMVWLLLECQSLWARHGPGPELVACLGRMSCMLVSLRQDYRGAYNLARHVLEVGEALGYEPQTSEARFVFSTYAGHWFEPLEDLYPPLKRAFQGVQAGGDASFACYVHLVLFTSLVEIAPTIDDSLQELDAGIALCLRTGNLHAAALHTSLRQALRSLRGLTGSAESFDDAQFNEASFLARMGKFPFVENSYAECRAMHALIMGDEGVLGSAADRGMAQLDNLAGYYMTAYAHFFVAMARAWELQANPSIEGRDERLAGLEASRHWLAGRAADQPANFLHLLRLVEAEEAWALGESWKAAAAFDAALVEAGNRQRPWHRAVITERAGLFHLDRGLAHAGRELLFKARDQYQAWGTVVKVAQLQGNHAFLRAGMPGAAPGLLHDFAIGQSLRDSGSVSSDALDLLGVLRASQALSSETSLERLTHRVTDVLASLTGATKVLVLSWNEGQWWLLGPERGGRSIPVTQAAERGVLPFSVVRYAERTDEPLLVDDALRDDRFSRDPYFAGQLDCSLLVVPIAGQGVARAMLILENRLGRAAFNAQRLDAVMLIAGQLAVSLANAQLYESLEERVQARTRELDQAQAELVATARRAGMAEIANNVLHNVGNVLNSINVSASVVRRTIGNSRIDGLTRAVELLNQHEHDLPAFFGGNARGKALLPYLNELVVALKEERDNTLGDLDRLARSVDHITYVVATQQSHSGPSSVLETAQPQELIEEALRLCADAITGSGAQVVRHYTQVPVAPLDRQRLLQILVNLIGNAAQAMDKLPPGSRMLTLGSSLVQAEDADTLRITVQDNGEGIAPGNLTRIFAHGFTTRKEGHGFGLHSSALAAVEMGGKLTVHSEGLGRGAVFTVELPMTAQARTPSQD